MDKQLKPKPASKQKIILAVCLTMVPIVLLWLYLLPRQLQSFDWQSYKKNPELQKAKQDLSKTLQELPQPVDGQNLNQPTTNTNSPLKP